jgi:hypothetical protein
MKKKPIINNSLRAAILLALTVPTAQAADFYFGEDNDILLAINSQLSIGSSWRMTDRNPRFYSANNTVGGVQGTGFSSTTDDDTLNFGKHDAFSTIIKGNNDFQLEKDDFGVFVRVKYWYDMELKDGDRPHGNGPNGYVAGTPLSDDGFTDTAKFSGIQLLDAYVYGSFDIANMPLDVRLGRQVVSWGESTFIQGGINSINPLDVSALRRPGAMLKEGLLPVGMLYTNIGVTENLSIEAFYQYEWEKTQIDGCGTFFASVDYAADGCNFITAAESDATAVAGGIYSKRVDDIEPDDGGQYGIAARYYSEALNDTEFGFYFMNIHARLPIAIVYRSEFTDYGPNENTPPVDLVDITGPFIPWAATADPATAGLLNAYGITDLSKDNIDSHNANYTVEFPEDLKIYGLSFATNVSGVALSGEISYKPDTPTQINGNHAVGAALSENPLLPFTARLQADGVKGDDYVRAWDEFDVTQLQVTAIQFFDQVLGASRVTFIGEVGLTLTDGVEDMAAQGYQYGRDTIYGAPTFIPGEGGFYTDSAWGYRARVEFQYNDLFAGIALKPVVSWYHDVDGYSAQFNEGSTVAAASLEALYQQKYSLTLSYTNFGGGDYNSITDKDFLSLSFALSY